MKTMKRVLVMLLFMVAGIINVQAQTSGDVNGDGNVNEADISAIIEIMKEAGGVGPKKYYRYVGWTKPTSLSHLQTLAVESTSSHGGSTTAISGEKLLTNSTEIWNSSNASLYVVIPSGYEIYDATLPNVPITTNSFTEVTDVTIENHKVYISNDGARGNSGLEIY